MIPPVGLSIDILQPSDVAQCSVTGSGVQVNPPGARELGTTLGETREEVSNGTAMCLLVELKEFRYKPEGSE
jgi:hypothetical protein